MNLKLRLMIVTIGLIFTLVTIKLLLKEKLSEKNSILWFIGTVLIFIFSIVPSALDKIAVIFGVEYPPSLLFLFAILILLFLNLVLSVQISMMNKQIVELTQNNAIKDFLKGKELEHDKEKSS